MQITIELARNSRLHSRSRNRSDMIPHLNLRSTTDSRRESPIAVQRAEIIMIDVKEVAAGARVVIGIGSVDAALVAGTDGGPDGDVVAFFDGKGGGGEGGVDGGDGGDGGLGEGFAGVEPDCAAEDGEVFGLVYVDSLAG